MPRESYSYLGSSGQRPFTISEPGSDSSQNRYARTYQDEDQASPIGIQAKEPDRQTTTRRGRSSRSRGMEEGESENRSRSQRGSARRGTQARRAAGGTATARRTSGPETKGRKKSRRGFAAMSPEQQREIARKGGLTVSRNRRHMADIGRIGGEHSHGGRRARR